MLIISLTFNVNKDWLLTGNGEMFNAPAKPAHSLMNDLTLDEDYVMRSFKVLSDEDKQEVVEIIKAKEQDNKNKMLLDKFNKLEPLEQEAFLSNFETIVSKNKPSSNK